MKVRIRTGVFAIAVVSLFIVCTTTRADTTITTFDTPGFAPVNALYASWSTAATNATPTNFIVLNAFTYGSLWKQLGAPPINAAGNTNLVLDVTLDAAVPAAAAGALTVIVDLKDGQSPATSFGYRFKGLSPGHHILVGNLFTTNIAATDNGVNITNNLYEIHTNSINPTTGTLDLTQLWHLNLELDPTTYINSGETYTIAFNDLKLTGSSNGTTTTVSNLCVTIDSFDSSGLAGLSGNWTNQISTPTNLIITAAGFGDGYAPVAPVVSTDSNKTLQVTLDLTAPAAANGKLGPLVVLQDGAGNQIRYAWYGQSPSTNLVLSSGLKGGTLVVGTSFDFTTISFFHLQLDPSSYAGAYTVAWDDLSVTGCTNTGFTGTATCATLQSFQNDFLGLYANWTNQVSTPTNLQITASGFGGGWQFTSASTDSNKSLRVNVTLEATSAAVGRLGPIVVLQDSDGTQWQYAWYGQSPGTNLVLTSLLSAGTPVSSQPGSVPGFNFSAISAFHVQLDPSSYTGTYTVAWNNLDVFGCAEPPPIVIISSSYNPSTQEFSLTWNSVDGGTYAVQSATDVTDVFNDLVTDIPSAGSNTTASVMLSDPNRSFVRVRKQ